MPIDMKCRCGRKATVPDSLAGKKGKCPACGEVMEVPLPTPAPTNAPVSSSDTIELQCPACSRKFRVSDVAAGKKWRCRCGEMVDVPIRPGSKAYQPLVVEEPEEAVAVIDSFDEIKTEENSVVSHLTGKQANRPLRDEFDDPGLQRVVVVNFDMKFKTLVLFLIKVAIASIPAVIILWVIGLILTLLLWLVIFLFGLIIGSSTPTRAVDQTTIERPFGEPPAGPFTKAAPARKKR